MLKQGSSRNQRNKGFKVKHVLQICLLLAISIWLLYQLKHSYDKKMALEVRSSKIFDEVGESRPDLFKLGRKDLLPRDEDPGSAHETDNKKDEDKEVEEEEEEQETKQEPENEEGKEAGDDAIDETDELDQERGDDESGRGEESTGEEDKVVHDEVAGLLGGAGFDEHDWDSQEAREEIYKRDDASSAVRHDTQTAESEFGIGDARSSDEAAQMEEKDVERENVVDKAVDGSNGNASNVVLGGENGTRTTNSTAVEGSEPSELEVQSISGSNSTISIELQTNSTTASTESDNQMDLQANSTANTSMEAQQNSTEVDAVTDGVPPQNGTVRSDSVRDRDATVDSGTRGDDKPDLVDDVMTMEQAENSNTSENKDAGRGESVSSEKRELSTI